MIAAILCKIQKIIDPLVLWKRNHSSQQWWQVAKKNKKKYTYLLFMSTSVGIQCMESIGWPIMLHSCCCRSKSDFRVYMRYCRTGSTIAPLLLFFFDSFYKWVVQIVTNLKPPKMVLPFINCAEESLLSNLDAIYTYIGT